MFIYQYYLKNSRLNHINKSETRFPVFILIPLLVNSSAAGILFEINYLYSVFKSDKFIGS